MKTPILVLSLVALATLAPGLASATDPYVCSPGLPVTACAGGEEGGNAESCDEPGTSHYGSNSADVKGPDHLFAVGASGWASCYWSDGPIGLGKGRTQGVGAGVYLPLVSVSVGWFASEQELGGETVRNCVFAYGYNVALGFAGQGLVGCGPAGAPPNPGWGRVLP